MAGAVVASPLAASVAHASSKPTSAGRPGRRPGRRRDERLRRGAARRRGGQGVSSSSRPRSPRRAWAGRRWTRSRASTPASRATRTWVSRSCAWTRTGNVVPGQATEWEVAADGMSWTFNLQPGLMWTNGDEVTADDYVASFQYAADPEHAWDFTWYYDGIIRNFGQAATRRGQRPRARSASRSARTSTRWCSRRSGRRRSCPRCSSGRQPLHAASLAQYGSGVYNIDPATAVTNGPYKLGEFSPDRRVVMVANTDVHRLAQADDRQAGVQHHVRRQRLRALPGGRDRLDRARGPRRPQDRSWTDPVLRPSSGS